MNNRRTTYRGSASRGAVSRGSASSRNAASPCREGAARHAAAANRGGLPAIPLFAVLGVIALVIVVSLAVGSCSGSSARYNWDNLSYENGRPVYIESGEVTSTVGVDVSSLQGEIDWEAVREDGIDFAMLRCGRRGYTEGGLSADATFYQNADACQAAGLPFGVYFFSQAVNEDEACEEADYVLELIQGMSIDYPVAFDLEGIEGQEARTDGLTAEELTRIADAFCERIQQAGYKTIVYGNQHDLARYDLDSLDSEVWYAQYAQEHPTAEFDDFVMWQYTNEGSVAGISTAVDMDILFENDWLE